MTNDLISRSSLRDAFCEHCDRPFELNITAEECRNRLCRTMNIIDCAPSVEPSVPEHMNAFEAAYRNGYEAAKRESGWISVDDAIPDNCRLVLVLMLGKHCFVGWYSASKRKWYVADQLRSSTCKYKVTHWMELPEPKGDWQNE